MIIEATSPEHMNNLSNEKNLVLILFYATWCGHCQDFEEHWEELKKNHPDGVNLAQVESEDYENYVPSKNEERIIGYPTIRLYHKDKMIKEYDGDRNFEDVYKFLQNYIDENNAKKNNMLVVKARRGNNLNKKLLEELRTGYKKNVTKKEREVLVLNQIGVKKLKVKKLRVEKVKVKKLKVEKLKIEKLKLKR